MAIMKQIHFTTSVVTDINSFSSSFLPVKRVSSYMSRVVQRLCSFRKNRSKRTQRASNVKMARIHFVIIYKRDKNIFHKIFLIK